MGATKVGNLKTVNGVLRRALKPGMPLPQFKLVVGALHPQLKPGMVAQLTRGKLERYYRGHKSENTQQVVDEKTDHFHVRINNSFGYVDPKRPNNAGKPDGRMLVRDPAKDARLKNLFYDQRFMWGAAKLFKHLQAKHAELTAKPNPPANLDSYKISRRYIQRWLLGQSIHETSANWKGDSRNIRTQPKRPGLLQVDLADKSVMATASGYKWILNAYDMYTKKLWCRALKTKSGPDVRRGMKSILDEIKAKGYTVRGIQTDNGSEFTGIDFTTLLATYNPPVKLFYGLAYSPQSQGSVEMTNRLVARLLSKYKRQHVVGAFNWAAPNVLKKLVGTYNNSWNSATGMTPNKAEADFINGVQNDIPDRLQKNKKGQTSNIHRPTYQKGDLVRLRLSREKPASAPSFTRSAFRIAEVRMQRQKGGAGQRNEYVVTYIIETLGAPGVAPERQDYVVYNDQLRPWYKPTGPAEKRPDEWVIKHLLRESVGTVANGYPNQRIYAVRWFGGYPVDYVTRQILSEDVPKLLESYEKKFNVIWTKAPGANGAWSFTSTR